MALKWNIGNLGDIADLIMGQSPTGDTCNEEGQGVPLLNGPTEFGGSHPKPVQFTTDPRKFAESGDLLFCVRGSTTGRMNWADKRYAIGRGLAAIRAKQGKENRHFIRAVIDMNLPRLLASATGSTFPNVSSDQIKKIECVIPTIEEQKRISAILGAIDEKIELNRKMNATLEEIARSLFQSWFVDFDPVRAKLDGVKTYGLDGITATLFPESFQNTLAGHIPKNWTLGKVSDVATINRDAINPGNFSVELFDHYSLPAFDNHRTPKLELGREIMSNKFIISPNSVLLSKLNPHISRIWLPNLSPSRRSICSTEFIVATSNPKYSREYLFSLFSSSSFASIYRTLVTGTTGSHQRVSPDSFLEMKIVIPSLQLVEEFTKKTKPIYDRINCNIAESQRLAATRDALLPKLMSGELSLENLQP